MAALQTLLAILAIAMSAYASIAGVGTLLHDIQDGSLAPISSLAWLFFLIIGFYSAIVAFLWRSARRWRREVNRIAATAHIIATPESTNNDRTSTVQAGLHRIEQRLRELTTLNHRMGEMLHDRDLQLASIRTQAAIIYWETDAAGRYSRMDLPAGEQRSEVHQLLGRHRWDDNAQLVGGASSDWPAFRERLDRQEHFDDLIVRRRAYAGGSFEVWEAGEPRVGPNGRCLGYRGVMIDLDQSAVTRTQRADTAAQRLALEASTREGESFNYSISHDLRAPLRTVEGFARILQEDYKQVLNHTAHEHLGRILSAAQRMDAMIEALLSLARLTSQPPALVDVDLSRLAHEIIEELRAHERLDASSESPGGSRQVTVKIEPSLRDRGDPQLLRLILQNLLGNAWKYSTPQRFAIITMTCERQGNHNVYCVSDNGVGFDMKHANRLFGAFQRLHSASEFPGTGIGLATAQRVVRHHEGRLWAYAERDRGATFYFTLWERRPTSLH